MESLTGILAVLIVIGLVALVALRRIESMKDKTSGELRAILRSGEWTFYRSALIELRDRKEDIRGEVTPILDLLISDSKHQRIAGWLILEELYPELAARVPQFRPEDALPSCREKLQPILLTSEPA